MIPGLKRSVFNFHDVMMYVAVARKHLRLMLLLNCFTMLGATAYYVYARPVYYSRSLVRVEDNAPLPVDSDTVYHDSNLTLVAKQLQAPHILERTARRFGVDAPYRDILRNYIKKITITRNSENNFEVEVWPYVSSWSPKWTQVMVEEFLKFREEQRIQYRESVVKSYNDEMAEIGKRIQSDIDSKFILRDQQNLTKAQIELDQIKTLPREMVSIKQRLSRMESARVTLQENGLDTISKLSLIASLDKVVPVSVGQVINENVNTVKDGEKPNSDEVIVVPSILDPSHPWEDLEKDQQRIRNEIAEASRIYLPGHRKMVALQKELDDVDKRLDLEYQVAKNRFDLEYQHLVDRSHELEARLPEFQNISKTFEKVQRASHLHDMGQLKWDAMFGQLAGTLSKIDLSADKERVNLEFLSLLEIKYSAVSPARLRLALLALAMGLMLAVGVPLLIEYLDHTVTSFEQVETTFQMRGLGIVPQVTGNETERPTLLDLENSNQRNLVENFRVIRTNLLSIGSLSKTPQVIMTTSAMPKEGKTVVSSNLAISFAQTGAKTLIIDTDLRRGRLHRLFGLRKGPGLSNILLEHTTLEEAVRPTGKENLYILTAGQHLESGTELLGSTRFAEMMEQFRARYDRIILDTPPVLGLSETSILQNHVDGVLFVIWSGRTPIGNMKTAIEMLQSNGANFYGFVLNRLDLSATTNYYQYYYYSNDYYHSYHALENA